MDGGAALGVGWIGGALGREMDSIDGRVNSCGIGGTGMEATGNSAPWNKSCSRESRAGMKYPAGSYNGAGVRGVLPGVRNLNAVGSGGGGVWNSTYALK